MIRQELIYTMNNKQDLEMTEVAAANFVHSPFPISLDAQKRLLELIYNRKSGIITRQELIDVLFSEEDKKAGLVVETTV